MQPVAYHGKVYENHIPASLLLQRFRVHREWLECYFLYKLFPYSSWVKSEVMGYSEVGSGGFPVPIEITVNGLFNGGIYTYKLVASNPWYTTEGEEKSFTMSLNGSFVVFYTIKKIQGHAFFP